MDIKISDYVHFNPEVGAVEDQVTACGRLAYAKGAGCIPIGWTTAELDTDCPLCRSAMGLSEEEGDDE